VTRSNLKSCKRIVVKVGTGLLTRKDNHINPDRVEAIVAQIVGLKKKKLEIILVTSGAVGLGLGIIKSNVYPKTLSERQALAAMGQSRLMHMYETFFSPHHIRIGQVLLTAQDLHSKERYLNIRNTLWKLLEFDTVPIINENDTVSVEEIKIGDNDTLSAYAALSTDADLLIILTDTDGLYDSNPKHNPAAKRFSCIEKIDKRITALAKGTDSATAIGGMETKLKAARIAASSGIPVVIASGLENDALQAILQGEDCGTFFVPSEKGLSTNERWFAHSRKRRGGIVLDNGCTTALRKKRISILPVGVTAVKGSFKKGDSISIFSQDNEELGAGLSNYDSSECQTLLGQKFRTEVIHCDNLVLFV